jgi:uncharacterized protein YdeI (YjbR/CyaY-like superfamily)
VSVKADDATHFEDRRAWRSWLRRNHARETEIWLLIHKKRAGKAGVPYEEAVEEAICFGWIDGKLRRIDDRCHAIRFTPRKPGSVWSESNRERAEKMIRGRRMTKPGLTSVEVAKKNGRWAGAYAPKKVPRIPDDLAEAMKADPQADKNFQAFANSYKSAYVYWVLDAKRSDTRAKRIREVVTRAALNKKPWT